MLIYSYIEFYYYDWRYCTNYFNSLIYVTFFFWTIYWIPFLHFHAHWKNGLNTKNLKFVEQNKSRKLLRWNLKVSLIKSISWLKHFLNEKYVSYILTGCFIRQISVLKFITSYFSLWLKGGLWVFGTIPKSHQEHTSTISNQ